MKDLGAKEQHIISKPYIPKMTGHSGRFQTSLKEDLEERK